MDEACIMLYHGATLSSAREIVGTGVRKRLHVTTDVQLAADYAQFRAAEALTDKAIVAFTVPAQLFRQWLTLGTAHERKDLLAFGCCVLYEGAWPGLRSVSTAIWIPSENTGTVTVHAAA